MCEAPRHLNFYERKIKVPEAAALVNAMIKLPICAYLSKGMETVNKLSELIIKMLFSVSERSLNISGRFKFLDGNVQD